MIKPKKFNLEETNIALLGSDLEKKVKLAAAKTEQSWKNAGNKVGIEIWRIEQFQVKSWPKDQYGKFFSGDSYIVLRTYKKDPASQKLSWDVHFWIGEHSTQDEYGTAAYKTVELDDVLGGEPVQHRELQGYESPLFLSYFPKIEILNGGVESGFKHVKPEEYQPRLLHVKGRKSVVVREVDMRRDSLNAGDVFILDAGLKIFQFIGSKAGPMEKQKGAELARAIDDERGGKPVVVVINEGDHDPDASEFWQKVGGPGPIKTAEEGGSDDAKTTAPKRLFRLSDETGKMEFKEISKVARSSLDSNDVFVFDAGFEIFVWVGKKSTAQEKANGMSYATDYLFKYNRPKHLPICRVLEGGENEVFEHAFVA
jgi:gelsolin